MTHTKNNIPIYEEQQFVNQEQKIEQIQETLSKFSQPIPNEFVELKQLNWMCSTQGWKELVCERYNCLIDGKWSQVDICHTLLEKLGLTEVKNIPYSIHISTTVIDNGLDHYLAYNVEKKEEMFLEKSFTIENLKEDIDKLFERIKELEELREQVKELEDLKREKVDLEEKVNNLGEIIKEKDEEIGEKERQVNCQKELIEKETKAKENFQKELEEIKNKKRRDWQSFYDWLTTNILDLSGKYNSVTERWIKICNQYWTKNDDYSNMEQELKDKWFLNNNKWVDVKEEKTFLYTEGGHPWKWGVLLKLLVDSIKKGGEYTCIKISGDTFTIKPYEEGKSFNELISATFWKEGDLLFEAWKKDTSL